MEKHFNSLLELNKFEKKNKNLRISNIDVVDNVYIVTFNKKK